MNSILLPVILQIAGAVIIIAEIILPSGGLLSLLAAGTIGYSLYLVFAISQPAGFLFAAADVIILPILVVFGLKMLAKSPATLRDELSSEDGVTSQSPELEKYLGAKGTTSSDLRPSGTAVINNKRLDVVSRGNYIDKDTPVVVCSVTGNQIVVKKIDA